MLFLVYWELNENLSPKDIVKVATKLMEKGIYPVEGFKEIGWYTTPNTPTWGVTIAEAENVETVLKAADVWTIEKPGFFKVLKISPAMTAQDAIRVITEM